MSDDKIARALELLREAARERADGHMWGHLLRAAREKLDLHIALPLEPDDAEHEQCVQQAADAIDAALGATLAHRAAFQLGRVFCLRCGSAECEHSQPDSPRHVFAGYGPSGLPQWSDFGELLLRQRHPDVERLYGDDARLITSDAFEDELSGELLDAFQDKRSGFRIHGQVIAGFFRIPDAAGRRDSIALTFQLVSTGRGHRRRRFGINLLGQGPRGESLEHLHDRVGALPWTSALRWGQTVAAELERSNRQRPVRQLTRRIEGLFTGLARRVERRQRSKQRRTAHAERRHSSGTRPTRMALVDLSRAEQERLLYDTRNRTLVVLGDRGRAHVFNGEGKLVTSVRYPPAAIVRKQKIGHWRPARADEIAALRQRVDDQVEADRA